MSKNYLHSIILVMFALILSKEGISQRFSNKGDRYFDLNLFEEAIKYYELEAKNGKDREVKNYAKKQLAECYRISGQFEEAEKSYRKVLKNKKNRLDPQNFLNYGKSLKSSAKFEEAKAQFEEFIKLAPNDPRGPLYLVSCDSAQKWLDDNLEKTVKNLEEINTEASDFAPTNAGNGKIAFSSSRTGATKAFISFNGGVEVDRLDLYQFNISDLGSGNIEIENMEGLNTPKHEGVSTFSKDGKEVYFTKTVKGLKDRNTNKTVNTLQVFYSQYIDSTATWTEPVSAFPFNSSEYSVGHPSLSPDGNTIYFMSDMPKGKGGTDIYYCKKDTAGKWVFPVNAGNKVNTFGHELFPYIADDGTLFFSSNGHPGMGQLDIFSSTYENNQWGNVLNMQPPVNSIGDDFGILLDGKARRGFFSSDRFNGAGAEDIYSFAEPAPLVFEVTKSYIRFKNTQIFDGLKYGAKDTSGTALMLIKRDGYFMLPLDTTQIVELSAKKSIFPVNKYTINIQSIETGNYSLSIHSNNFPFALDFKYLETDAPVELKSTAIDNGMISVSSEDKSNFEQVIPEGIEVLLRYK